MHNVVAIFLFFFYVVTSQKHFADTEVAEVKVVMAVSKS